MKTKKRNKLYGLGELAKKIQNRNIQQGINPQFMRVGETLNAFKARMSEKQELHGVW